MDDVEVRELRYFVAVAEELNFSRAAERLGMAQPPLSAAIGKLERKLGVVLLERTSRRVALTRAGTVLLEQARVAVDGVAAAVERARRAGTPRERLVVTAKPGAGTPILARVMRRWTKDPQLPEVRLLLGHPAGPVAALRSGAADVAILRKPFDARGLDTESLLVEPRVAILAADHRLAERRVLCRADLAGEPMPRWAGQRDRAAAAHWAGSDTPTTHDASPVGVDSPADPDDDRDGPEINDLNQLFDAVACGDSVAYVPASLAEQNRRPELTFLPVSDLSPSEVVAAWPRACRSRSVALFVRSAVEAAADRSR